MAVNHHGAPVPPVARLAATGARLMALPRLTALQPPRNVHFTAAGAEVLADQVAQSIREALRLTEPEPS